MGQILSSSMGRSGLESRCDSGYGCPAHEEQVTNPIHTGAAGTDYRNLWQVYQALEPLDRAVLQLLSVIYTDISNAELQECARHAQLRPGASRAALSRELAASVRTLIKRGLVTREYNKIRCRPHVAEVVTRAALEEGTFDRLQQVARRECSSYRYPGMGLSYGGGSPSAGLGQIRMALYSGEVERAHSMASLFEKRYQWELTLPPLIHICTTPFDARWFATVSPALWRPVLEHQLRSDLMLARPVGDAEVFVEQQLARSEPPPDGAEAWPWLRLFHAEQLLMRGQPDQAVAALEHGEPAARRSFEGWREVLQGAPLAALEVYDDALQQLRRGTRKRRYFASLAGPFHLLALAHTGTAERLGQARQYLKTASRLAPRQLLPLYELVSVALTLTQGDVALARQQLELKEHEVQNLGHPPPLELLFLALVAYWLDPQRAAVHRQRLRAAAQQAQQGGHLWLASEAAELLGRLPEGDPEMARLAATLRQPWGGASLVDLLQPKPAWEHSLKALVNLRDPEAGGPTQQPAQRLIWLVQHTPEQRTVALEVRVQRVGKRKGWTRGRRVSLKKLLEDLGHKEYFTDQDRRICACVHQDECWRDRRALDLDRALPELVGHPLLFDLDEPTEPVELVAGQAELLITDQGQQVALTLAPEPFVEQPDPQDDFEQEQFLSYAEEMGIDVSSWGPVEPAEPQLQRVVVERDAPGRLRVTTFSAEHLRIAEVLGLGGLRVPREGRKQVLAAIEAVAPAITVQSDIGAGAGQLKAVEADSTPRIQLSPAGDGISAQLWVRPLRDGGPYYRPGTGGETVVAEVEGARLQTRRDRDLERRRAGELLDRCATLDAAEPEGGVRRVPDLEQALEVLLELQALGDDAVVEWPEGRRLKLRRVAGVPQLFMRIARKGQWFEASGQLEVDEQTVLQMGKLLELSRAARGRFVPIGDGEFVALTRDLSKRLEELRAFTEQRGQQARFSPLAAAALDELTRDLGGLETDRAWQQQLQRMREAGEYCPELPSTLRASLRDYQLDGFCWLARLAHWGVGACLADDMGLGKTVQALAVMLTRAAQGPSMVVAPTSVCGNWEREAQRFAPTLRVHAFGLRGRAELLSGLGPFDLLVCSYGLLHGERDRLAEVPWQAVVLDEAQAIKNPGTKRSSAAMKLQGELKLITTGTPIENHLGELWNLFRFINPGLLGSRQSFDRRFAGPIERDGDREARRRLKKLVRPFILRRTKSQVLEELPPRTEVTVKVRMGQAEAAMYEALRLESVQRCEEPAEGDGPGHVQVLTELTRLRRACCNPRLVAPATGVPSAKLEAFCELLADLLAGGHRVLVFSQFVTHLALVREALDPQGVTYQYLDGSTPAAARQKRVDAFQAGEGDAFLISLKAGGQGLNLTGADYVIHLDPWWNPAVEDQASDRAHRIGQLRPVTIYRLVMEGTIEEKIVDLHHRKRDLADKLLEGTEAAGKLSTVELLELMRDPG